MADRRARRWSRPRSSERIAALGSVDRRVLRRRRLLARRRARRARARRPRALAVTAVSPGARDRRARRRARGRRARSASRTRRSPPTSSRAPTTARNDRFRCFHCKTELYDALAGARRATRGYAAVLSGANADDAGDWRPGPARRRRARRHPPAARGRRRQGAVRALAARARRAERREAGEPVPGLAHPLRHAGRPRDARADRRAERAVRALGYRELRVRHHGELGRLELAAAELEPRARSPTAAARSRAAIRVGRLRAGRDRPEPFRSGSLTAAFRGTPLQVHRRARARRKPAERIRRARRASCLRVARSTHPDTGGRHVHPGFDTVPGNLAAVLARIPIRPSRSSTPTGRRTTSSTPTSASSWRSRGS